MDKVFESTEKHQLERVIGYLVTNEALAEKGEDLPATLRALGIGHTLLKYYPERKVYDMLVTEIKNFEPDIFKLRGTEEIDVLQRIAILNQLPVQTELMLFDFLMSFAVEFRRVAKVIGAKKKEEKATN